MTKMILGWSLLILLGTMLALNAAFMLLSPKAWFRLPGWLRAQGALTEEKYGSGWGAIQVRLTGAIGLLFISWVLFHSLFRQFWPKGNGLSLAMVGKATIAIVGLLIVINAGFMLASPRAWFRLPAWLRVRGPLTEQKHTTGWGGVLVRFLGALLALFAWVLFKALIRIL